LLATLTRTTRLEVARSIHVARLTDGPSLFGVIVIPGEEAPGVSDGVEVIVDSLIQAHKIISKSKRHVEMAK